MPLPRLSPKQKAGAAALLALLLWLPSGVSSQSFPVVTGHSTFYNGESYDPCLAAIAGIMRTRVMWFNDMVLAEQYGTKGTFIYVTESGAPDPRAEDKLYSEGVFYDFVDPNGAHWHVEEAFIIHNYDVKPPKASVDPDPMMGGVHVESAWAANRTFVWIVELAARPIHDEFAGDPNGPYYHDLYNFLMIVDTCKMHRDKSYAGVVAHNTTADLSTGRGHPVNATAHEHEAHNVDLWVGKRPTIVPISANPSTPKWHADWAVGYAAGNETMPCRADDPRTPQKEGC